MKTYIQYLNESIDPNKMSEEEQIKYVRDKFNNIKYIDNPNLKVQLAAIDSDERSFRFIKHPFEEAKLVAVKKDGFLIQYFNNPSEEIQLEAVKVYPSCIYLIHKPNLKVQTAATHKSPLSIYLIDEPFEEIKKYVANNMDFNQLLQCQLDINIEFQQKVKNYITKEIYYKMPKDFPWIPEIKEKFKNIDRFKRFNL